MVKAMIVLPNKITAIVQDGGVHSLQGAAAGALLAGVGHLSRGVNSSVDNDDDGPAELGLEVLDDLGGDRAVVDQRAVGDAHEDVLVGRAVGALVGLLSHGVDEDQTQALLEVLVRLLKSGEGLGGVLLELGGLDL